METHLVGKVPYQIFTSAKHRISFLYFEYGKLSKERNSLIFTQGTQEYEVPAAQTLAILLGPGTSITQPAVMECSRWGCSINFVAQNGASLYSSYLSGGPSQAYNQIQQAKIVSNPKLRLAIARNMYAKRWGSDNVPKKYTISQLMRLEGARMKKVYEFNFHRTGLKRVSRVSKLDFLSSDDELNKALTVGNNVLYGIVNTIILSLGFSPSLGIVHNGNIRAFVFDIADLYKESFMIPLVFDVVSSGGEYTDLRRMFRERQLLLNLIPTIIEDIFEVLELKLKDRSSEENLDSGLWVGEAEFISSQEREEQGRE